MAAVADLLTRTRLELGDLPTQFTATLAGDGTTVDFYCGYKPVDASYASFTYDGSTYSNYTYGGNQTGLTVKINGATQTQGTAYTVEENKGLIHFTTAPTSGAVITVTGTHFRYFTTNELLTFIGTAVLQHTDNRTDSYGRNVTIDLIPPVEEYPVALLATVEALWALATDAAFDINITAPDGVTIPRGQRYQQLSNIIQARKEQYRELCSALNVGLWRIEMGTLRRVSRTTNRLVPVYMSQEIDDSRMAERVFISNNLKGRSVLPDPVAVYDIVFTKGDTYSVNIDLPISLTGCSILAQARTYPGSPIVAGTFTSTVTDAANGKLTLSLTADQTGQFPLLSFWDLQVTDSNSVVTTYLRGNVFANYQVSDSPSTATSTYVAPTFIADSPTATGKVGTAYSYTFSASGPDPVYYLNSGVLPIGVTLNSVTGTISGTPTTAGTYTFTIRVYDSGLVYSTAQTTLPTSTLYTVSASHTITVSA